MTLERDSSSALVGELCALAAARSGCAPGTILQASVQRAADELIGSGISADEVLQRARAGDRAVVDRVLAAACVAETFFFRNQEQLAAAAALAAARRGGASGRLRAWSAGCATGEEAWSLAAALLEAAPAAGVEVLGTDLVERNLEAARRGVYRPWSLRGAPAPRGSFAVSDELITIAPTLRASTRFEQHNLLDAPPAGPFDVVVCRNVLLYLAPDAARRVIANVLSTVSDRGVAVFGTLEIDRAPPGFRRSGRPELQIFERVAGAGEGA